MDISFIGPQTHCKHFKDNANRWNMPGSHAKTSKIYQKRGRYITHMPLLSDRYNRLKDSTGTDAKGFLSGSSTIAMAYMQTIRHLRGSKIG